MRPDGMLKSGAATERFEDEDELEDDADSEGVWVQDEASELGRGKRCRMANKFYTGFWKHKDNEASDEGF